MQVWKRKGCYIYGSFHVSRHLYRLVEVEAPEHRVRSRHTVMTLERWLGSVPFPLEPDQNLRK